MPHFHTNQLTIPYIFQFLTVPSFCFQRTDQVASIQLLAVFRMALNLALVIIVLIHFIGVDGGGLVEQFDTEKERCVF